MRCVCWCCRRFRHREARESDAEQLGAKPFVGAVAWLFGGMLVTVLVGTMRESSFEKMGL